MSELEAKYKAALEEIARDRWCSGDDLADIAGRALGFLVEEDATPAGQAPTTQQVLNAFKSVYTEQYLDWLLSGGRGPRV